MYRPSLPGNRTFELHPDFNLRKIKSKFSVTFQGLCVKEQKFCFPSRQTTTQNKKKERQGKNHRHLLFQSLFAHFAMKGFVSKSTELLKSPWLYNFLVGFQYQFRSKWICTLWSKYVIGHTYGSLLLISDYFRIYTCLMLFCFKGLLYRHMLSWNEFSWKY
jgi:hypothetical protein